ncbi:hypothetical protein Pmani_013672 [Petrolisthes manimaculis]|uniref:DNA repair protein RAD51 homolog 3 n=1 Tax=Petrolisthes manimaculis TaxID=1843537 RepID=A0AAE1U946_9EUCA|nr:hypothetical protein Pmani_013672 [Petrolisthes manimaculis]
MNTNRPLDELGFPAVVISRLLESDFVSTDDVQNLQPAELGSATGLSLKESAEVVRLVSATSISEPQDVLQIIEDESDIPHIVTFCEAIDTLLGGGIPLRAITEISGTPGIGKTQMCLQVCVSVQVPVSVGGVGGQALFIDTEGSFTSSRIKDMASHAVHHVQSISTDNPDAATFTVESILKGIHYFRCHNYIEVLAVIRHLPTLLQSHPNIRLVVIDSVAFHFRHDFSDNVARTGLLCQMTHSLIQLAGSHNLAVIVTNQMTTKIENSGSSQLVAALGETWGHCPTLRLSLHWQHHIRVATLIKAPHIRTSSVNFQVTVAGIRDISSGSVTQNMAEAQNSKKRKWTSDDS